MTSVSLRRKHKLTGKKGLALSLSNSLFFVIYLSFKFLSAHLFFCDQSDTMGWFHRTGICGAFQLCQYLYR